LRGDELLFMPVSDQFYNAEVQKIFWRRDERPVFRDDQFRVPRLE
jgi:hypothetical protein